MNPSQFSQASSIQGLKNKLQILLIRFARSVSFNGKIKNARAGMQSRLFALMMNAKMQFSFATLKPARDVMKITRFAKEFL